MPTKPSADLYVFNLFIAFGQFFKFMFLAYLVSNVLCIFFCVYSFYTPPCPATGPPVGSHLIGPKSFFAIKSDPLYSDHRASVGSRKFAAIDIGMGVYLDQAASIAPPA